MSKYFFKNIIEAQKKGIPLGIYSACSANELVIEALMERALKDDDCILIEATANQVNQYGGYTRMKPLDFKELIFSLATKVSFPKEKIILGGDHLGPLTWKDLDSKKAMEEAKVLIQQFVLAGFTKIHIDTSMHLGDDDKNIKLDTRVVAKRGAVLCEAAEKVYEQLKSINPNAIQPVYVIGSEVPIPGGSQGEEESIQVTKATDLKETVEAFKEAFYYSNLQAAWESVIAVVVQPGVEFGDESIHEYNRDSAKELTATLKDYPNIVFEGHSTDYQTAKALKKWLKTV